MHFSGHGQAASPSFAVGLINWLEIHPVGSKTQKGNEMPTITVEGPPIKEIDKKRELVREVTNAAAKAYGLPREIIVVVIKENSPENVSVAGQLLIDRKKSP